MRSFGQDSRIVAGDYPRSPPGGIMVRFETMAAAEGERAVSEVGLALCRAPPYLPLVH